MKVIIIGAGLVGVTTAYSLMCQGHEVTVIDRQEGAGRETSFANGALLTPSMADPWNSPGCWRVLLSSLARSDAALQLRWSALPGMIGWGASFLWNSRTTAFRRNALSNLRLALYSLDVMQSLRHQTGVEYGRTTPGTLRVFRDPTSLARAVAAADRMCAQGLDFRALSRQEAVELEPALAPIEEQLSGALHYGVDEIGDAYQFCVALANHAQRRGVAFRYGTAVSSLELDSGRVVAVLSGQDRFVADFYVVAAGSYSTPLLRQIGLHLPVRPAKGYSVTLDHPTEAHSLRIPLVDDQRHTVVVPMEGAIRIVGMAEFAGYTGTLSSVRIQHLLTLLREVLPRTRFDCAKARPWCGLRPMSVDGVPIIGRTPLSNLLVNTGHGHLGWTMAAGSGQLLADLMSQRPPSIDPEPFSFARFRLAM